MGLGSGLVAQYLKKRKSVAVSEVFDVGGTKVVLKNTTILK
jgi:hypothetical protein